MTERHAGFGAWGSGAQPFSAPRHSAREPLMIGGSRCLQPAVGSPSLARGSGLGSSPSRVLLPMLSSHAPTSPSPQDCSCALFQRSPRSWGTCSRDPAGPPEGGSHGAGGPSPAHTSAVSLAWTLPQLTAASPHPLCPAQAAQGPRGPLPGGVGSSGPAQGSPCRSCSLPWAPALPLLPACCGKPSPADFHTCLVSGLTRCPRCHLALLS